MKSDATITEAVRDAAVENDGRQMLRCTDAFDLAKELSVDLTEIRRISDEANVKIINCQLGCF